MSAGNVYLLLSWLLPVEESRCLPAKSDVALALRFDSISYVSVQIHCVALMPRSWLALFAFLQLCQAI